MSNIATDFPENVTRAIAAASAYYNGDDALMSDDEYDALAEDIAAATDADDSLLSVEGVDALLNGVAAGTAVDADIRHTAPMLSLSKSPLLEELEKFVNTLTGKYVVEPKVDGIAAVVRYKDGKVATIATRGNGEAGKDITDRVKNLAVAHMPHSLDDSDLPDDFEVRGEIYMSPSDFDYSNEQRVASGGEPFANSRNATSGTVMRETVRYSARASFAAYEVIVADGATGSPAATILAHDSYTVRMGAIAALGFSPARDLTGDLGGGSLSEILMKMEDLVATGAIAAPLDGAVVKADSNAVRESMGASSRHPRWAMAFKFAPVAVNTVLLDIERAIGRTGNVSYRAIMEPVIVAGSLVTYSTLHNFDFIAENDFRIGDTVRLYKAGEIIPRIKEVVLSERPAEAVKYDAPTTCPVCIEELNRDGVIWNCVTPSCSIAALITYAVSRDCLDVDHFSTAIADALVEQEHITTLSDLFDLDADILADLVTGTTTTGGTRRLGKATADKIMLGLEAAKSQPLNRVVCALGIRKSGRTMSRRMVSEFRTMDALVNATEADFVNAGIEGIGEGRAAYFVAGFAKMSKDIEAMKAAGVNMGAEASTEAGEAPLAGKKVVVTGSMTGSPLDGKSRNEMNELIESFGGKSSGSVSSSTDILVCGEEGSSKWKKAKELGTVQILTPDEFAVLLGL